MQGTTTSLEETNAQLRAAVESRTAASDAAGGCCDGGKCHAPPAIDLPEGYAAYTLTPAVQVPEATFEDPMPVAAMPQEQLEAAWAGVKERQRKLHERLVDPQATDSLDRRVVGGEPGDVPAVPAVIPQAGTTTKFGTGAVRSDDAETTRYDLISPIGLRAVAAACVDAGGDYGNGGSASLLLSECISETYKFLGGSRESSHLAKAALAIMHAIQVCHDAKAN